MSLVVVLRFEKFGQDVVVLVCRVGVQCGGEVLVEVKNFSHVMCPYGWIWGAASCRPPMAGASAAPARLLPLAPQGAAIQPGGAASRDERGPAAFPDGRDGAH